MPSGYTIDIDKLAATVMKELEKYAGATADVIEDATKATARSCVAELKQTSPKDTGEYARAWTSAKQKTKKNTFSTLVYVKAPHYRLTHYLMNGHIIKNQYGTYAGRTRSNSFVHDAERNAIEEFEKRIIDGVKEVGK